MSSASWYFWQHHRTAPCEVVSAPRSHFSGCRFRYGFSCDRYKPSNGNFSADSFEADLSGAAKFINTLNISGKELNIECSGASELSLKGDFKEADIELSGAARFQCSGSHTSCTMECSGAAKIDMDGDTDTFELEGSGACNINAKGYHAKKAFVELSGACTAKVKVSDDLRHDVGTTCKLTYFGSPEITDMSQSKNVVQGKE